MVATLRHSSFGVLRMGRGLSRLTLLRSNLLKGQSSKSRRPRPAASAQASASVATPPVATAPVASPDAAPVAALPLAASSAASSSGSAAGLSAVAVAADAELSETAHRNVAFEAVRIGNYYSEDQAEVLAYIAQMHSELLNDAKFLRKYAAKLNKENGLSTQYTVPEILAKKHEADGFDLFLPADEAIYVKETAERKAAGLDLGYEEPDPVVYGELQEGLTEAAYAAAGECAPLGPDELLFLLQHCCRAGEVGAAVWGAERLEAVHEDAGVPDEILNPMFEALKPLLRPRSCRNEPRLTGPWSEKSKGKTGPPNPRRGLGLLLMRLAELRKTRELAKGGDASARADRSAQGEETLGRLCTALVPLLAQDSEAAACKRRGPLVPILARVCKDYGLEVSTPVAWDILRVLEQSGEVQPVDKRGVELKHKAAPATGEPPNPVGLKPFSAAVAELDALARDRLGRRRSRQKSREQGKSAKRRREEGS